MRRFIRLQLNHEWQAGNKSKQPILERALDRLKTRGLEERPWDKTGRPGIIRHETGPVIIAPVARLPDLIAAILHLVAVTRKAHPETTISITVTDPADLERVLSALALAPKDGEGDGEEEEEETP